MNDLQMFFMAFIIGGVAALIALATFIVTWEIKERRNKE